MSWALGHGEEEGTREEALLDIQLLVLLILIKCIWHKLFKVANLLTLRTY